MPPVGEPTDDGEHAAVARLLHASLTAPTLDAAVRARHLHAIRARAAAIPASPAREPVAPLRRAGPVVHVGPRRWGRRLASAVSAAGLVVVMGASGAVAASHHALPGDALYPVKAATEQVVLATPLPTGRAVERRVSFAQRRLDEAAALVDGDAHPMLVAEAIAAHTRLMAGAGTLASSDTQLAARVDAATIVAQARLTRLLDRGLPALAADQARAALSAADTRLDQRPATPPSAPPAAPLVPGPLATPPPVPSDRVPRDPTPGTTGTPAPATPAPATPGPARPPTRPTPVTPGRPQADQPAPPAPTPARRPSQGPASTPEEQAADQQAPAEQAPVEQAGTGAAPGSSQPRPAGGHGTQERQQPPAMSW